MTRNEAIAHFKTLYLALGYSNRTAWQAAETEIAEREASAPFAMPWDRACG